MYRGKNKRGGWEVKSLYMETTNIPAERTTAQIQEVLGRYGASAIMTEYEGGEVKAISFRLDIGDKQIPFRLPCRWEAIYEIFINRPRRKTISNNAAINCQAQAKKVAWRQILRWVEAQLALTETNMVKIQEVFMPYVLINGQTFYEKLENEHFPMLTVSK
jgi:hypothetical protein